MRVVITGIQNVLKNESKEEINLICAERLGGGGEGGGDMFA